MNSTRTANQLRRTLLNAVKPIKKVSVSSWADSYRMLPSNAAEPGRWKTSRAPYTRAIMDAFTANNVHRVAVKSSSQIGKTEIINNIIGRYVHLDPCTIMLIQPTLEMAQDFSKARLSKLIADTKVLTPLFYGKNDTLKTRDAKQTILSKFFVGGRLVLGGANSPAGLASRPIRILLCDEVDRFPPDCGEGDPVDLAAKRTTTYWNYKLGLFSTPTAEGASRIDTEYLLGTQEEWRHCCPNCESWERLDYRQMQVDYDQRRDDKGNKIVIVNDVKWRCPQCGFEFDELTMKAAPQKYIAQNADAIKNGIRSFWLNGFSSPWLTWALIMREWLEAKGNATREMVVMNTRFGESYKLRGEYDDENVFLERREDYDGEIPSGVLLLTAAVDVQANRLEYEVVGWSAGFERWGICKGVIRGAPNDASTWQALDNVLDRVYRFGNGTPIKIARTFIDSGYSTAAVYEYCRAQARRGRYAIKGKAGMGLPLLYKYSNPKNTGILLTILGVDDGKSEVMSRLGITTGNEGFMHFPRDDDFLGKRGYDRNYFKGLISEHRVLKKSGGVAYYAWETIAADIRNEPLDLSVYNFACVQSCVGKNPAAFWARRRELLKEDVTAPRRVVRQSTQRLSFREVNLWSE